MARSKLKPTKTSFLLSLFTLAALSISSVANASSVAISINDNEAPANDLVYRGHPIDRDQAMDLKNSGVDLSTLDPLPSDAWENRSFPAYDDSGSHFPEEGAAVSFDSDLPSAQGMFRTRVVSADGAPFQLIASLSAHASLARAALLRRLGYPIPSPKWYRSLTLRFADVAARDSFLDKLSDSTLTARTRWVRGEISPSAPYVTLQDVVLERAQIDVPMYHWGVVPPGHLKGRRVTRALIVPLVLLDIQESVNLYSWELGKVLNGAVVLTHPYADSFGETTYADAKWIAARIAALSRDDLAEIVAQAKLPEDVSALVLEKVIARRNQMVELFMLAPLLKPRNYAFPYDVHLNHGAVYNGKLRQANYDGYADRFSYGDPDSPVRKSEVARYLLTEGLSDAISGLFRALDQKLVAASASDVMNKHRAKLIQNVINHYQNNPNTPYVQPISAWGGPTGSVALNASRDVVTGTYYGSDSKVQLVDNFSMQASVGYFMGVDGVPLVTPIGTGNLVLQRNYIHVRPIADMKSALHADWSQIWSPGYMKNLASLLGSGDTGDDNDAKVQQFLDSLKEGEMFMVSDSLVFATRGSARMPVPVLMNPAMVSFDPQLGVAIGSQPTILRRTTFVKTADGVQVYIQNAKTKDLQLEFNFDWFVNLLRLSYSKKGGEADTKAYLLDHQVSTPKDRHYLALALKALIQHHDPEILEESFSDFQLHHESHSKIKQASLLWWKWAGVEESHALAISPPDHPDKVRDLFSHRIVDMKGTDGYGFFMDIAGLLTNGLLRAPNTGLNPANSFLGRGTWVSATTEAETTPGTEFDPVTVIEHHFGGWAMPKAKLFTLLGLLENKVKELNLENTMIRTDEFETMKSLQMYDVLSTLVLYKEALDRLNDKLIGPGGVTTAADTLIDLQGRDEMQAWCRRPRILGRLFHRESFTEHENGKRIHIACIKPWMRKLLKIRHKLLAKTPLSEENLVRWSTRATKLIEKNAKLANLLKLVGKDNFFFQFRVSGFRTQDENGDSDYVSDTLGSVHMKEGAGVFKEFADKYGIMSSELYARYLSEAY